MKIEHVAIWVNDIDKVCDFYRKYFGGAVHPLYHNPTKQFTSRFITFEDGARLEIMHRPDIKKHIDNEGNVGTMAKPETQHEPACCFYGFAHISFSVGSKEEVDLLTQQMSNDGITIAGQPRTTGDGYYESVVLDPEGNRIEITV